MAVDPGRSDTVLGSPESWEQLRLFASSSVRVEFTVHLERPSTYGQVGVCITDSETGQWLACEVHPALDLLRCAGLVQATLLRALQVLECEPF